MHPGNRRPIQGRILHAVGISRPTQARHADHRHDRVLQHIVAGQHEVRHRLVVHDRQLRCVRHARADHPQRCQPIHILQQVIHDRQYEIRGVLSVHKRQARRRQGVICPENGRTAQICKYARQHAAQPAQPVHRDRHGSSALRHGIGRGAEGEDTGSRIPTAINAHHAVGGDTIERLERPPQHDASIEGLLQRSQHRRIRTRAEINGTIQRTIGVQTNRTPGWDAVVSGETTAHDYMPVPRHGDGRHVIIRPATGIEGRVQRSTGVQACQPGV